MKCVITIFSKKKYYDGSQTLKIIGNDCKLLENNIDTFISTFMETENDVLLEVNGKLRQSLKLYVDFKDLARLLEFHILICSYQNSHSIQNPKIDLKFIIGFTITFIYT